MIFSERGWYKKWIFIKDNFFLFDKIIFKKILLFGDGSVLKVPVGWWWCLAGSGGVVETNKCYFSLLSLVELI